MPVVAWAGLALGLVATFTEARRIHRKYGLLLASVVWLLLAGTIATWLFCVTVNNYNFGSPRLPVFFHVYHFLLIVVAPVALAVMLGRKFNASAGIFTGGVVLACTSVLWISMLFAYGTSAAAYG
ncbi:hypothetical protein [Shinella zoogloeoides]|uniref:hypothetical protein n=1 Tax=Shinella zoogloeoides TaxID=352475 RepID=UPI000E6517DE|nr:hypothetical protein [Shinella zoogloeoides]